jgi:hypothetical protein
MTRELAIPLLANVTVAAVTGAIPGLAGVGLWGRRSSTVSPAPFERLSISTSGQVPRGSFAL